MKKIIGKSIKSFVKTDDGSDDKILMELDDGTLVELKSWDYEGYESGIEIKINGKEVVDNDNYN